MTEQPYGAHEEQRPPETLGLKGLSERETVMGIRFFAAARVREQEAIDSILNQPEIKLEDLDPQIEAIYNPILGPRSLDERRQYWETKNISYDDALAQWKERFKTVVNRVTDTTRISTIRSILPEDNPELREKNLNDLSLEDATVLFRDYSENKSDIDKFMRRAIADATDLEVLKTRLPHLRWVATGFFGSETASMIETQILIEAESKNNWDNTRNFFADRLRPQPEGTQPLPPPLADQELIPPPAGAQTPNPEDDDGDKGDNESGAQSPAVGTSVGEAPITPDGQKDKSPDVEDPTGRPQGLNKENIIERRAGDTTNLAEWVNNHLKNQTAVNVTFSVPPDVLKQYLTSIAQGLVKGGLVEVLSNNTILLKGVQIEKKVLMATAKATVDIIITNRPVGDGIDARLQNYYNDNKTANTFGARGKIEEQLANINTNVKRGLNKQIDPKANPLWRTERILIAGNKIHIKFNKGEDLQTRPRNR